MAGAAGAAAGPGAVGAVAPPVEATTPPPRSGETRIGAADPACGADPASAADPTCGADPVGGSAEQFGAYIRSEVAKFARLAKERNIVIE